VGYLTPATSEGASVRHASACPVATSTRKTLTPNSPLAFKNTYLFDDFRSRWMTLSIAKQIAEALEGAHEHGAGRAHRSHNPAIRAHCTRGGTLDQPARRAAGHILHEQERRTFGFLRCDQKARPIRKPPSGRSLIASFGGSAPVAIRSVSVGPSTNSMMSP